MSNKMPLWLTEKHFRIFIVAFLGILACYAALFLYRYNFYEGFGNGFIVGDWLINYHDGGFKRRGLSGTLIFAIQDISGISLQWIVFSIQLLLFLIFLSLFTALFWNKRIKLLYFGLIFSPLTFLSYFNDYGYLGRKEFLLFTLFTLFLYLKNNNKLTIYKEAIILLLIAICTLFHELHFFYTPYFIVVHYLSSKKAFYQKAMLYMAATLIPTISIAIWGQNINEGDSISILQSRGIIIDENSIFAEFNLLSSLSIINEHGLRYLSYIFPFLIGIVYFAKYIDDVLKISKIQLLLAFSLVLIFTLPMFVLALDWGRWIQIHFMMTALLFTYLTPITEEQDCTAHKSHHINYNNIKYLIFIALSVFWGMKHCYWGFYPGGAFMYLLNMYLSSN